MVFESGAQLYMWYVENLIQTHNDVDWAFYDAILVYIETSGRYSGLHLILSIIFLILASSLLC